MLIFKKYQLIYSIVFLILTIYIGLSFGSFFINIVNADNFKGILEQIIILRAYRVLTAFIVGGALAVAGTAYQAVLRNPLAEPFILGISGGASIGAAVAIVFGVVSLSYFSLPLFAFVGAIVVLSIVLILSRGKGVEYSNNVMLSGIIVGSLCSSILMFIISTLGEYKLNSITWWMLGNLQPVNIELLIVVGIIVVLGTFILFLYGRSINVISLGEEMAYYLGISPLRLAIIVLSIASLLTAAVVSLSGIIGFVGLIVPHILRRFLGTNHRRLFPLAFIYGGIFMILCDTFARTIMSPQVIPVGVVTALVGGPFFLWVLNKKRSRI
jgi:iron complex transport system permease protein